MHPAVIEVVREWGWTNDNLTTTNSILTRSYMTKHSQEFDLEIGFSELGEETDKIMLECRSKLRYCIGERVRVRKFLEKLATSLEVVDINLVIYPPRTIALRGLLSEDQAEEMGLDFKQTILLVVQEYVNTLFSASAMIRLSSRLPERGGTEQYRKLPPSLLAMFSVFGHLDTVRLQ